MNNFDGNKKEPELNSICHFVILAFEAVSPFFMMSALIPRHFRWQNQKLFGQLGSISFADWASERKGSLNSQRHQIRYSYIRSKPVRTIVRELFKWITFFVHTTHEISDCRVSRALDAFQYKLSTSSPTSFHICQVMTAWISPSCKTSKNNSKHKILRNNYYSFRGLTGSYFTKRLASVYNTAYHAHIRNEQHNLYWNR